MVEYAMSLWSIFLTVDAQSDPVTLWNGHLLSLAVSLVYCGTKVGEVPVNGIVITELVVLTFYEKRFILFEQA